MKAQTKHEVEYLFNLSGKKRFLRILGLFVKNQDITYNELQTKYERLYADCWEMTTFYDRITNKGFRKYSPTAVQDYFKRFIETIKNAIKYNLIKL